ncbi:bile acid-sensitive ion channel-like [Clavelina lepadiformis]|uniref:bile acid-sensitive ion channel-like n=1 Tax=Clavelina lepadiformis TaxID=159417 RepID=UPI0040425A52
MATSKESKSKKIQGHFAETTSMHGILRIHNSKRFYIKAFWFILVLTVLGVLIYQIVDRFVEYFAYKTTTQISERYVQNLTLPAITICNYNRYFNLTSEAEKNATQALSLALDYGLTQQDDLKYFDSFGNDFSLRNFMTVKGWQLKDSKTLIYCATNELNLCDASNFEPVLTKTLGLCWTLKTLEVQKRDGYRFGVHMSFNVMQPGYTENPLYGNWEAGIKFQVHSPDVPPQVDVYGQSVGVGLWASAAVHKTQVQNMYAPWGPCDRDNENLQFHSTYSLPACMRECHDKLIIANCSCREPSMIHYSGTRECTVGEVVDCVAPKRIELANYIGPDECGCSQPCDEVRYASSLSYSTFPSQNAAVGILPILNDPSITPDYLETNLVGLSVYYDTLSVTTSVESKAVTESGLISDVGGQLGLWIGMSVVTLFEIFQFAYLLLRHHLNKPDKKKEQQEQTQEMENIETQRI